MEMRLRALVTRGYFFLPGALCLVNVALLQNINQKKYPLEPRVVIILQQFSRIVMGHCGISLEEFIF